MRYIYLITCIVVLLIIESKISYSQNNEIDSLKRLISNQKDTTKVNSLVELSYAYFLNEIQLPDSGILYANKAMSQAKKLGFEKGVARSYFSLGRAYYIKGQYRQSLRNYIESLAISEQIKDEKAIGSNYYYMGQIYYELFNKSMLPGGLKDALKYYRKAIVLFKKINFSEGELGTYTQLGFLYQSRYGGNLDSAEFYLGKALKGFQDLGDVDTEISMHLNMGNIYLIKKDFKKAENELLTAVKMSIENNRPFILPFAYDNLGVVNFQTGDYIKAIEYYKKSIEQSEANPGQFSNLPNSYNNLAGAYKVKKEFKKAIEASKRSLNASKNKNDSLTAYFGLSDDYFQSGDFKAAYEYYNKYVNFKDMLASENESSEIVRLQKDNEAAEQESKIILLEKEAEINNLAIAKQKQTQIFFVIIIILTLMIIGILINRYRLSQKTKKEQEIFFKELDHLKSRFFSNISHEFRTPLTLILAPLENRLASATESADKAELGLIQRSALRLLTLVNQLLDLSRLEAGSLKLKCIYADLQGAILSISSQFSSMADSKGIIFEVIAKQPVPLFFDQDKLEKIITNLLSNAFKFTSDGGTVTLTIDRHGPSKKFKFGTVEIGVRDTGMGIQAEHLPRIFDRFYQVDMSNTRAYEGSGIGLSLTKELVDLHHGTIEVRSEIGKGSIFTVHLPLGKDHLKPDEISSISEDALMSIDSIVPPEEILILQDHALLQDSILIIEDNTDLRSYIRNEFQHSYKMLEAADGEEGVAIAIREIPTLILSDLMMPKKDGLTVCHEIKMDERTSHIPIILLTAKADIDSKLQGYQQGADDYIAKPFNLNELSVRIQNLITIRKNLQVKFSQPVTVLPSAINTDSADGRFLKRAVEIVEGHLTDSNFGVEPLAHEMNVSQTQLYRKLQAVTGSGPNEFIRHIRLHYAANLLRNKSGNVSEVAFQAGFNNLSYFSKVFKEKFGVTPLEFLKNPTETGINNKGVS